MTPLSKLPLNSTVSFELYPSYIIGTGYNFAKVLAHLDADTARALGVDTASKHANVYPTLPSDVPNRPNAYPWVKLRLQSGETVIIGAAWVKENTIKILNAKRVRWETDVSSDDDAALIVKVLAGAGFQALNMEVIE
ncbi:hypothetical protein Xoosp14_207 [Xanthomonas phage Xoo-sp14]|nr:hypothetical protein Xoosp14_207 [Xanthomonas phage Xoo-sp14]